MPKDYQEVVSDETNRLYVKTKKNPDGELITGSEVDEWLTTYGNAREQAKVEEIIGIAETMKEDGETPFGSQELHETEVAYNKALQDLIEAIKK